LLGCEASGVHVHRWRYAKPTATLGVEPLVEVVDGAPLAFAGDAFHGGRVEGAALSGLASAAALTETLAARTTG
jgi:predicted NAD/FAD-dependent oxidoreductase